MVYSTDKRKGEIFWRAQVFDIQNAPEAVKEVFFRDNPGPNDTFISYYVYDEHKPAKDVKNPKQVLFRNRYDHVIERGDDIVADWLFANGAKKGSRVLINRWW